MAERESELVKVSISHHSLIGVDLLPDVLRQLSAMVRLLTDFASDPRYSKVEVLSISKNSDLTARLRVVTVKDAPKVKGKPRRGPIVRTQASAFRRLERAYATVGGSLKPRTVDATGLTALKDFAEHLKSDVATIETEREKMVVDSSIIRQINDKLGPITRSHGRATGFLEGLNIHAKPWHFTIYPEIGPSKIRCFFDDVLFDSVRAGIGHVVTVHGIKEFVADSPWPLRIEADKISTVETAPDGAWLELAANLAKLWDEAPADERDWFLEEYIA